MKKQLTLREKKEICKNYKNKTMLELAKENECSAKKIFTVLKKEGVVTRKRGPKKGSKNKPDRHEQMLSFAKSLGFRNAAEATQKYGSREFIKMFKNRG
ncbi:hypothetical protein [Salinimicrobium sp. GXAS 041]|uniref:hypothetical protein n=1 Tax=Salinimicrobium sp. GXAS 041 TaxID=3400806 RepID=UPI003C739F6A